MVVGCPHCPYSEVWAREHSEMLFQCKNAPACGVVSCLLCAKRLTALGRARFEEELAQGLEAHRSRCFQFRHVKEEWERAMERGQNMFCPGCATKGRKDDGCTHIACEKCRLDWCYVCGAAHADHTKDCPPSMDQVAAVDGRWPRQEAAAMEFFHRKRTLRFLRELVEQVGLEAYRGACEVFPQMKESGFSEEAILNEDVELIKKASTD